VAVASLVGLIRLAVISVPGDPGARTEMLSAALFVLVFGAMAVVALRAGRRAAALDRAGPVEPAPAEEPSDVGRDGRWSIDQVAAQLARDVAPMNGVVYREGGSRRLRVMLDPTSAIAVHRPAGRSHAEVTLGDNLSGLWWRVTWRRGRAPRIRQRSTAMSIRIDETGRALPRWQLGAEGGPFSGSTALRTAQRTQADISVSSDDLVRVVDALAVRSGWASRGEVASTARRLPHHARRVVRSRTGEESTESHVRTTSAASGEPSSSASTTVRSAWTTTSSSSTSTGWTTSSRSRTSITTGDASSAAATGQFPPAPAFPEEPAGPPPSPATITDGVGRVMTWVGAAILAACVLATLIGLLAGMVWWASFIIIGSGLLFCLLFVLPWVLIGRAETRRRG
jgi:hypothetical protein